MTEKKFGAAVAMWLAVTAVVIFLNLIPRTYEGQGWTDLIHRGEVVTVESASSGAGNFDILIMGLGDYKYVVNSEGCQECMVRSGLYSKTALGYMRRSYNGAYSLPATVEQAAGGTTLFTIVTESYVRITITHTTTGVVLVVVESVLASAALTALSVMILNKKKKE